jgi:hypothetical protein
MPGARSSEKWRKKWGLGATESILEGDPKGVNGVPTATHSVHSCEARAPLAARSTLGESPAEAELCLLTAGGLTGIRHSTVISRDALDRHA